MEFQKALIKLQNSIDTAIKNKVDLQSKLDSERALYNYKEKQKQYYVNSVRSAVKQVKSSYLGLIEIAKDKDNQEIVNKIYELIPDLDSTDLQTLNKTLKNILSLVKLLDIKEKEKDFGTPKVPQEIYAEIKADIEELNRCFKNECYRSSVILCGRLLETALHRKYFEVTKNDLLEKSPGIGLGNLVAKLVEKRVPLDPALTNQIHLINQVRIFCVHKKKEAFNPSKQQAQATILYTLDILDKLWQKP
ncbi:MAG TPA: DUF4145 domain-containing protein [Candidatus Nanoarchaeia archaeon]|nr:DUF4145 domain-containing protein [Candidatus Nanoarchaeia archaeon]